MAPPATGKPKRKRQRKRRDVSSEPSSSSGDSSSSEDEKPAPPKLPTPSASSDDDSSSAPSSSSDEESSDDGRGRRKGGRGGRGAVPAAGAGGEAPMASTARRPYPSRSPSPAAFNPANLPLGQSPFPMLKPLEDGPILMGLVPGDVKEGAGGEKAEEEKAREAKFGEWWRARLVSEFETELGGLAAEPGLTAPRLNLLLTSLTSLSTLHTTTSSLAASSNSIWLHDPSTAIDPLAALEVDDAAEEWGKKAVGGRGDVEVGEEGVTMDQRGKAVEPKGEAMEVDDE